MQAFEEVKAELTKPIVQSLYDLKAKTKIVTDASSYGLGAGLLEQMPDSQLKPVPYTFRLITENQMSVCADGKMRLAV